MLLRNHPQGNELVSSYDLRWSSSTKYVSLKADPFVVVLANNGLKDIKPSTIYNPTTNKYNYTSFTGSTPVYVYRSTIVNAFGYSYTSDIEEKSISSSFPLTASNIATALANSQSGVIVSLNGGCHYLVITGDRGVSYSDPNDRFIICDPGTTSATYGDNVPWSSSSSSYSFSDITKIYYYK